ncbi:MAG TPA: DUF4097 family beta strand repeat-containing protein [Solirubrobacteraceae bacterium]
MHLPIGDLRIETGDGEESTVTIDGTSKIVEATNVELAGDRLIVAMRRRTLGLFGRFDGSLRLVARIPHHSDVELVTASGEAALAGSFAGLELKGVSGGLRATGEVTDAVRVNNVSGDVRLPRIGGNLTARTVSGDIDAESVGGSISAKSVSGRVRVGSVREGEVNVQSVSGDVELGIAVGSIVDVDARSASGALRSEVPLSDAPVTGGGPAVVVRGNTASGDFRLFRAA